MDAAWQSAALARIGARPNAVRWVRLSGGTFGGAWRLESGGGRYFVKTQDASRLAMLEAEADGLRELSRAGAIRVPASRACASAGGCAFLVLEWLDFGDGGRDAALGAALAQLHRTTADRYGWRRGNAIGATPQDNRWSDDWAAFFRDRRIGPQLELAARNGSGEALQRDGERLLAAIPSLLAGHAPAASLLHGDLWCGNAARLASGEAVIYDPAVYFGDREADLAMTELFGGFGSDFHAAYRAVSPVDCGYAVRRTLYNLYHVLNHFNLFGGGYDSQAQTMIAQLLTEVR
ncbi:MAG TPA: fructosamine kinase family protein [Casimicrobiaceae bacterium]|nr:fructosamine kinase family protein [Casimicrobiaceae bacterium]